MAIVMDREIPSVPAAFAYFLSMKVPQCVGVVAFAPEEYAPWSVATLPELVFFTLGSFLAWRLRSSLSQFIEEVYDDRKNAEIAKKLLLACERRVFPTSEFVQGLITLAEAGERDAYTDARLIIEIMHNSKTVAASPTHREIAGVKRMACGHG